MEENKEFLDGYGPLVVFLIGISVVVMGLVIFAETYDGSSEHMDASIGHYLERLEYCLLERGFERDICVSWAGSD